MNKYHFAGKCDSRRHCTTGFNYQECCSGGNELTNIRSFIILQSERAQPPSIKMMALTFLVKKVN